MVPAGQCLEAQQMTVTAINHGLEMGLQLATAYGLGQIGAYAHLFRITSYNVCYTKLLRITGQTQHFLLGLG